MYKFLPYLTNDNSIGLFNEDFNDIYHSAFGALTEAYEKFVNNILYKLDENKELRVLDICYGIGYNTKALITEALNKEVRLNIDCVDTDRTLIELSPFIKTKLGLFTRILNSKKLKTNISKEKTINKICNLKNNLNDLNKYRISKQVNFIILKNLIEDETFKFLSSNSKNELAKKQNSIYFDKELLKIYEFLSKKEVYLPLKPKLKAFVHNIYYKNISRRYIYQYNKEGFDRFTINFYPEDIRRFILDTNNVYDIVFLDGFTPAKCPCIWSLDFFDALNEHMNDNGVLLTYNTSACVRNAMKLAGFFTGNILSKNNKCIGTIASKSKNLINNNLSEKEQGLLLTKAGIPYRDKNLNLDNDSIIHNRKSEINSSDLISASQYLKNSKE